MLTTPQATPRILVAHPDEGMCETLGYLLQDEGYQAVFAVTFDEAVAQARAGGYTLILTEVWQWSHAEPLGRTRELREQAAPTPVGILTSWPIPEALAEQEGFACVIPAPFDVSQLIERIANVLAAASHANNHG